MLFLPLITYQDSIIGASLFVTLNFLCIHLCSCLCSATCHLFHLPSVFLSLLRHNKYCCVTCSLTSRFSSGSCRSLVIYSFPAASQGPPPVLSVDIYTLPNFPGGRRWFYSSSLTYKPFLVCLIACDGTLPYSTLFWGRIYRLFLVFLNVVW